MSNRLNHSVWYTLAVALLLATAGCQTTQQNTTTTPATTTEATATETLAPPTTTTTKATTQYTTTTQPALEVNASITNCTQLQVDANQDLRWVGVLTTEGVSEYNPNGSTLTVDTDAVIEYALVQGESGEQVRVENSRYGACVSERATTTSPPATTTTQTTRGTTERVTTHTGTPTMTATTTTEPTTTVVTTTRVLLDKDRISRYTLNESLTAGYTKVRIKNWHDTTVRFDYDVVWYEDRDIMEGVDRHSVVLGPGESVVVESWYSGNGSAYGVEYVVNNLEYANEDNQ